MIFAVDSDDAAEDCCQQKSSSSSAGKHRFLQTAEVQHASWFLKCQEKICHRRLSVMLSLRQINARAWLAGGTHYVNQSQPLRMLGHRSRHRITFGRYYHCGRLCRM